MSSRKLLAGVLLAGLCAVASLFAHTRLIHPSGGAPLWWQVPGNISITVNSTGSDNLTDGSHMTALRNAIDAWNGIEGTTIHLTEDSSAGGQARTDWASDSVHLMWFDETNSSGYFPFGSGTVAITPVWFYSNGRIADADVLFNGKGFNFTTSAQPGRYDIQDVGAHELGHLLGLDHTGFAGGTMYPYVDPSVILHRSLSQDEHNALRGIYPSAAMGSITGTIRRSLDGSVVKGAHVVARDSDGRPVAATLTGTSGAFVVTGLAPGNYSLYTVPLDFPVAGYNLGAGWTIQTDFEATLFGNVTLSEGQTVAVGGVLVGADVSVSLGRNFDPYPLRCKIGQTSHLVIRGSGLNNGSSLSASDPSISVTATAWYSSQVALSVTVPAGAQIGHVDLMIIDQVGDRSILTAGLELTPPDPTITLASPNQGDIIGGTNVTVFGSNFNSGARVVFGGEIYTDGEPGGCTVVDANTITLNTRASAAGIYDVVVIDASGVEGRKADGFQFVAVPVIEALFPATGSAAGGTELRLVGENFGFDTVVRINGVNQGAVFASSSELLTVITEPGSAGGPYLLELENAGGAIASTLFSYVLRADPQVTNITPGTGSSSGGEVITLEGLNFGLDLRVRFGGDPNTGAGGVEGTDLLRLDSHTVEVTTPIGLGGVVSVILEDMGTGQASVTGSGFTFLGSSGGGGCYTTPVEGPRNPGDLLRTMLWFAMLALGIRVVQPRRRRLLPLRIRD